jgi:hypothetical protein
LSFHSVNIQFSFEVYKNERKQYYSQYLNAEAGMYTLPAKPAIPGSQAITPSTNIIAEDIDEKIFWEWILEPGTLPANHQVAANHFASQLMSNAQYDLTIPQELGIPDKIISSEDAGSFSAKRFFAGKYICCSRKIYC